MKPSIKFKTIIGIILVVIALFCILPFWLILVGSISDNTAIVREGYSLLPRGFSTMAYKTIFRAPKDIGRAYLNTMFYTGMGTSLGLLIVIMTAYVISKKDFKYRNQVSFLIYFTSIFGGGMIPWYLMYANVLNLKGTMLAIWFPALITPFYIILMRTFIKTAVPDAIIESAKIDGAKELSILFRIVLPIIVPGIATVGLFLSLGYWNDWYRASLFSTSKETWSLQFYLYEMLNSAKAIRELSNVANINDAEVPGQTTKLAMAIVATGPVLMVYPFVQKYFVKGLTVGAVKG